MTNGGPLCGVRSEQISFHVLDRETHRRNSVSLRASLVGQSIRDIWPVDSVASSETPPSIFLGLARPSWAMVDREQRLNRADSSATQGQKLSSWHSSCTT